MDALKQNKILYYTAIIMFVISMLFIFGIYFDNRLILGINPWIKPLKFSTSIIIYALTMIIVLRNHEDIEKKNYSQKFAITMWIEMFLITLQSIRGVRSHFNQASTFDIAIFAIMGLAILYNTFYVFKLSLSFFKKPNDRFSPNELLAIKYGLVLFLLGSIEGGFMSSINHHTIAAIDGGPGLKFINWSTIAGDLRVSHFIGIHGIQILLALYFMAKYVFKVKQIEYSKSFGRALTLISVMILILAIYSFIQAMNGISIVNLL